jgi:hypothetical protein
LGSWLIGFVCLQVVIEFGGEFAGLEKVKAGGLWLVICVWV